MFDVNKIWDKIFPKKYNIDIYLKGGSVVKVRNLKTFNIKTVGMDITSIEWLGDIPV